MSEFTKCDLTFMCRQTWETLQETGTSRARYCDKCDKSVFPVRTRAELEMASAVGRCVALTDNNGDRWLDR